jgi:hypothetical protein
MKSLETNRLESYNHNLEQSYNEVFAGPGEPILYHLMIDALQKDGHGT